MRFPEETLELEVIFEIGGFILVVFGFGGSSGGGGFGFGGCYCSELLDGFMIEFRRGRVGAGAAEVDYYGLWCNF